MEERDEYLIIIGILCLISTISITISIISLYWRFDTNPPIESCVLTERSSINSFNCTPKKKTMIKDDTHPHVVDIIENGVYGVS